MSQAFGGAGPSRPEARTSALHTLSVRTDLPPRVRNLLEGVLALCSSGLERAVVATLNEVEMQLFKLAEQGRSNETQHRCFETLREVKRGRADVAPRYMLAMEDALSRFDQREAPAEEPAPKTRPGAQPNKHELALLDTSELEESLALQEFAAKNEIRQATLLYALGHRFGVLGASPAFDAEHLPIGPVHLGKAMQSASACLDIIPEHRVLLYRTFDRIANAAIGPFYEAVNTYLIEQRILRHLRAQAPQLKHQTPQDRAAQAGAPATPEQSAASNATGAAPAPSFGAHAPGPARASADWHSPAQPMPSGSIQSGPTQSGSIQSGSMQFGSMQSGPAPSGMSHASDERDSELFTTLRELLAGRRHALGVGDTGALNPNAYQPSGDDVQAVLGALQAKPISPLMMGGKLVQRSVGHLKQDLLAHLRQLSPDGRAPQLGAEDSDTIDLVGMLFDYITKNVRPDGSTQSLMTKLQVPLLRVALRDKSFFTRRTHPARQLLNAIAETGSHWLDDSEGPQDRDLVDKMQMVVDRVTQEFDGDLNLFEDMMSGLSQHMHTLARKAEVTERRHVDAAKGREKLALARQHASEAIGARITASRPNKLVRTVLEQAWTDVLALTLLRQGENSEMYKRRLAVADKLLASETSRGGEFRPPAELREEIETGLDQVGYHKDDIQAVVKRLFVPELAANEENPSSNTEIAIKLKSKTRLGEDSGDTHAPAHATSAAPAATPERPKTKLGAEQASMLERLKTLPYGTWFEFRTNQQGDIVRRKLAWFSTLTGRCLFVNQRGARTDEKMLEQLAFEVVAGQASIVEPEQDSLVDRAWKAIVSSLRNLVGRDPAPQPA